MDSTIKNCGNAISNNRSGFASYVLNNQPMYFYYEPLGIDDYYAISAIPQESIETERIILINWQIYI